jgi:hypothetical protein
MEDIPELQQPLLVSEEIQKDDVALPLQTELSEGEEPNLI